MDECENFFLKQKTFEYSQAQKVELIKMFCNDFEVNEAKYDFEVNFQKVNSRSQQFLIVWFCSKNERRHAVR